MTRPRVPVLLALALPSVVLAGLGFSHPMMINASTTQWWMTLHIILIPIFPLLGVAIWVLLRGERGALAWTARIAAFGYMVFYGALDAISGVGAGALVRAHGDESPSPLFAIGSVLGRIGALSLLAAAILTVVTIALGSVRLPVFLPGAAALLVGAYLLREHHIYWPGGVLAVLAIGAGLVLLELGRRTPVPNSA